MHLVYSLVVFMCSLVLAETQTAPAQQQAQPAAAGQPAATATTETAAAPVDDTPLEKKPHFGVIGGVNLGNYGRDLTGTTMRLGFMGGVFIELPMTEQIYLSPNLWYIQKGYRDAAYTVNTDFIELPVNIVWKKPMGEKMKLRVFLGPQVGYMMTKNQTGTGPDTTGAGADPGLKAIDFGINGGLGLEYSFGKTNILLEARYQYGLSNINDTASASTRNSAQAYTTNGIMLNLGAFWPL